MSWLITGSQKVNWDPSLITTTLWLDAADTSTVTVDGSNLVSQWSDKSGNGNNATASGSDRPTLVSSGLNSLPVISFPLGQRLQFSTTFSGFENTYMLLLMRETVGNIAPLVFGNLNYAYLHYGSSWYTESSLLSAVTMNSNTWYSNTSIDGTKFSNGTSAGNSGTTSLGSRFNSIGNFAAGGARPAWNLAQMIFFNGSITIDTRQRVEGYWAHRYALTSSLPNDHPYKVNPPAP